MVRVLTLLTLTTAISACSTPQRVVQSTAIIDRPNLILPETTTLDLQSVDFVVITPENAQKQFETLEAQGKTPVFFALSASNYENLSINMQQILQLLSEQKAVIMAYENYYIIVDSTIAEHNAQAQ